MLPNELRPIAVPASAVPRATPTSPSGCTACTPVGDAITGSAISCPSTDVASSRVAGRFAMCGGVNRSSLNAARLSWTVTPFSVPATSAMYTGFGRRRLALLRASSTVSNHSRVLAIGLPRALTPEPDAYFGTQCRNYLVTILSGPVSA